MAYPTPNVNSTAIALSIGAPGGLHGPEPPGLGHGLP